MGLETIFFAFLGDASSVFYLFYVNTWDKACLALTSEKITLDGAGSYFPVPWSWHSILLIPRVIYY